MAAQARIEGLERLGESVEFGLALLDLLGLPRADGKPSWTIVVTRGFSGGTLVIASRMGHTVQREGETIADVASDVFMEAMRVQHWQELGEFQLRLM